MSDYAICDVCHASNYWVAYSREEAGFRCINCLPLPTPRPSNTRQENDRG